MRYEFDLRVIFDQWPKLHLGLDVWPKIPILKGLYCKTIGYPKDSKTLDEIVLYRDDGMDFC